jgi:hypothetical protein
MKPEIAKVGVVGSNPIARSNFNTFTPNAANGQLTKSGNRKRPIKDTHKPAKAPSNKLGFCLPVKTALAHDQHVPGINQALQRPLQRPFQGWPQPILLPMLFGFGLCFRAD